MYEKKNPPFQVEVVFFDVLAQRKLSPSSFCEQERSKYVCLFRFLMFWRNISSHLLLSVNRKDPKKKKPDKTEKTYIFG